VKKRIMNKGMKAIAIVYGCLFGLSILGSGAILLLQSNRQVTEQAKASAPVKTTDPSPAPTITISASPSPSPVASPIADRPSDDIEGTGKKPMGVNAPVVIKGYDPEAEFRKKLNNFNLTLTEDEALQVARSFCAMDEDTLGLRLSQSLLVTGNAQNAKSFRDEHLAFLISAGVGRFHLCPEKTMEFKRALDSQYMFSIPANDRLALLRLIS
jgi:hypothetical protein